MPDATPFLKLKRRVSAQPFDVMSLKADHICHRDSAATAAVRRFCWSFITIS
jgi:hypothetical protein